MSEGKFRSVEWGPGWAEHTYASDVEHVLRVDGKRMHVTYCHIFWDYSYDRLSVNFEAEHQAEWEVLDGTVVQPSFEAGGEVVTFRPSLLWVDEGEAHTVEPG